MNSAATPSRSSQPRSRMALLGPLLLVLLGAAVQAFVVVPPPLSRGVRPSFSSSLLVRGSISLPNPFGGGGGGGQKDKASNSATAAAVEPKVQIREVTRQELPLAAAVCIDAFFNQDGKKMNPIKSMQLASLQDEQLADLRSRFGGRRLGKSVMLQAVDEETGAMVGFVELSLKRDLKYGLGEKVKPRDERPYLANLSVRPSARRRGIGRALVVACEDMARSWGFDELILQVEDTNQAARNLYRQMGYADLYTDNTGRKYVLQGFKIVNTRINKIGMRKELGASNPLTAMWGKLF